MQGQPEEGWLCLGKKKKKKVSRKGLLINVQKLRLYPPLSSQGRSTLAVRRLQMRRIHGGLNAVLTMTNKGALDMFSDTSVYCLIEPGREP